MKIITTLLKRNMSVFLSFGLLAPVSVWIGGTANAQITVTNDSSAASLEAALLGGGGTGILVNSFTVFGHVFGLESSTGTYTSNGDAYGLGGTSGIVLSTGNAASYSTGPNTELIDTAYGVPATGLQEGLMDPITGGGFDHFDVTQIDVNFDMVAGFDTVFFDLAFGSEEFPDFVGDDFIDGFGLYVNGTNIAFSGGLPLNINHPDFLDIPETELNGVLAPVETLDFRFPNLLGMDQLITHLPLFSRILLMTF